VEPKAAAKAIFALQPSHQDDTGRDWHEYLICGDIVDRTIALMPQGDGVKAWEKGMGLTGSNNYRPRPTNTGAFDAEVARANAAGAGFFVSIHTDGGAPSGVLGESLPGDAGGAELARALVSSVAGSTGLPSRGTRVVRLYSLEKSRARYRALLEIGDNEADRAFLRSPPGRQKAAIGVAAALRAFAAAHPR